MEAVISHLLAESDNQTIYIPEIYDAIINIATIIDLSDKN